LIPDFNRVAIIGTGRWGQKVVGILQSSKELEATNISARKFLEHPNKFELGQIDLIWVCTTPDFQLEIIRFLVSINYSGAVVIEKPFYEDGKDFQELLEAKNSLPKLRISNPWTFSQIWLNARSLLTQKFQEGEINIVRSGWEIRNYLTPPRDWLFHDLLLLEDLARVLKVDLTPLKQLYDENKKIARMEFCINTLQVSMAGGYSQTRTASWQASNGGNFLTVDFNQATLKRSQRLSTSPIDVVFQDDHPLCNMLDSFSENEQTVDDFKKQLMLVNTI